jgi:hypothetical protein
MKKDAMQRLAEWRTGLRYWRSTDRSMEAYRRFAVERTDALSRACKYFELDPDNPKDAGVLLRVLAEVVFEVKESKRPKGTMKWGGGRLFQLFIHWAILVERGKRKLSDSRAAVEIRKRYPAEYAHIDAKSLRKRLPVARHLSLSWLNSGLLDVVKKRKAQTEDFASNPRNAQIAFEGVADRITAAGPAYREQVFQGALDFWEIEKVLEQEENMAVVTALVRPPAT